MWSDCPTPVGSDCLNMKTFVGRIVTVPDGAGRSVTVSNWGVAQSSRHRHVVKILRFHKYQHLQDYAELLIKILFKISTMKILICIFIVQFSLVQRGEVQVP